MVMWPLTMTVDNVNSLNRVTTAGAQREANYMLVRQPKALPLTLPRSLTTSRPKRPSSPMRVELRRSSMESQWTNVRKANLKRGSTATDSESRISEVRTSEIRNGFASTHFSSPSAREQYLLQRRISTDQCARFRLPHLKDRGSIL